MVSEHKYIFKECPYLYYRHKQNTYTQGIKYVLCSFELKNHSSSRSLMFQWCHKQIHRPVFG